MRRSLFILSLPRSLSTRVYRIARYALALQKPSWTHNGEILNHDLFVLSKWPKLLDEGHKYVTRENDPGRFAHIQEFLDQAARPTEMIYKDVVHPFVLAEWRGLEAFCVLKIQRDLVEVAEAVLRRGWAYPRAAAPRNDPTLRSPGPRFARLYVWSTLARRMMRVPWYMRLTAWLNRDAVLTGLILAERALARLPGEAVCYDDLVADEEVLREALRRLYPEIEVPALRYIDEKFVQRREAALECRHTRRHRRLAERISALRATLPIC